MAKKKQGRANLRDLSDRELVEVMGRIEDRNGWVLSEKLAEELNLDHINPMRCVSSRMSWMARWGLVEGQQKVYRLTDKGRELLTVDMKLAEQTIRYQDEADVVALTEAIARRRVGDGFKRLSEQARTVTRRAWAHHR